MYSTDQPHPPQMHFGAKPTHVPLILSFRGCNLCSRPLWSAAMPGSLCAHTTVTFSGITKESTLLIEIPRKIKQGPWKSYVKCSVCQPSAFKVCVVYFAAHVQSVAERFALSVMSVSLSKTCVSKTLLCYV